MIILLDWMNAGFFWFVSLNMLNNQVPDFDYANIDAPCIYVYLFIIYIYIYINHIYHNIIYIYIY